MEEIKGNQRVYNVSEIKGLINLSSDNRKTYIHYIKLYIVNINMCPRVTSAPRRHPRAVHVVEPRGLECHVASTCTRVKYTSFFAIFLIILNA